ncbi:MAG TPA: AAA family ATPase, partial [Thermomicrobiaceae bacterium]|nr:AAA family ATPase [Thermomicrobiaceae bacterium]
MPTRLKRLDLHGFKSFATPTTFVFDPGITAVIGPNGSGKSNIADALRWVLGEQSYATLRGRRTEDVIFAGSAARTPLGMAEVALTLDNESGELPTPFAEVTITRRAYRSGENQYLINGARVRLKDVAQVTAALGQAYTVIGQGLVDSVLAQRPEERRGLFEHAAGITGLRLKHAESERHLAETQTNSARLEDLLREVEPRLRGLERAARQAREYDQLRG